MALASSVLMLAGSLQMFVGAASAQETLFLLVDLLPAYGRQLGGQLEQKLIDLSFSVARPFAEFGFAFQKAG